MKTMATSGVAWTKYFTHTQEKNWKILPNIASKIWGNS